ncbi:MAG: hypothetical protein ACRDVE_14470 [Actinocrinis sp.]
MAGYKPRPGEYITDEAQLLHSIDAKLGDLLTRTAIVVHPGDTLVIAFDRSIGDDEFNSIVKGFGDRDGIKVAIVENASHFAVVRHKEAPDAGHA